MRELYTGLRIKVIRFESNDIITDSKPELSQDSFDVDNNKIYENLRKKSPIDRLNDLLN